jgi:hypothetical protein
MTAMSVLSGWFSNPNATMLPVPLSLTSLPPEIGSVIFKRPG